jgi:hypothetical protein
VEAAGEPETAVAWPTTAQCVRRNAEPPNQSTPHRHFSSRVVAATAQSASCSLICADICHLRNKQPQLCWGIAGRCAHWPPLLCCSQQAMHPSNMHACRLQPDPDRATSAAAAATANGTRRCKSLSCFCLCRRSPWFASKTGTCSSNWLGRTENTMTASVSVAAVRCLLQTQSMLLP